ncbi:tyrosine transporter TyrP, partial [Pseudoalteromonas sp. APAL1]|nr:tyrosine transporter TyrP [Pseudoalteromonas sp. APAL1]
AMVYKQRSSKPDAGYQVKGGNIGLALAALFGVLIISAQGLQMAGLIPAIG